jgi:Holliday junction resolvase RusA-like endonuclease
MKRERLVIPGRFPGLNEFISANRVRKGNYSAGNSMKRRDQARIRESIMEQLPGLKVESAVSLVYHFFEPDRRRDKDNIAGYFHKVFQDALVECGVIEDDKWENVSEFRDLFDVDKEEPRIEVLIKWE